VYSVAKYEKFKLSHNMVRKTARCQFDTDITNKFIFIQIFLHSPKDACFVQ